MPDNSLSLPRAAVLLRLPYYSVYRLALSGVLGPITRQVGQWRLDANSVRVYLEQRDSTQSAQSPENSTPATDDATDGAGNENAA